MQEENRLVVIVVVNVVDVDVVSTVFVVDIFSYFVVVANVIVLLLF